MMGAESCLRNYLHHFALHDFANISCHFAQELIGNCLKPDTNVAQLGIAWPSAAVRQPMDGSMAQRRS